MVEIDGSDRGRISLAEEPKREDRLTTDDTLIEFEVFDVVDGRGGHRVIVGSFFTDD